MIIGTDESPEVCKREGYIQMNYNVKTLQPRRQKQNNAIDADAAVNVFAYTPADILEEQGYFTHGTKCMTENNDGTLSAAEWPLEIDECITVTEFWETYLENKSEIDSMINSPHVFPKTPHELLQLASDLSFFMV